MKYYHVTLASEYDEARMFLWLRDHELWTIKEGPLKWAFNCPEELFPALRTHVEFTCVSYEA